MMSFNYRLTGALFTLISLTLQMPTAVHSATLHMPTSEAVDSYIDQTFGATFLRSGPAKLVTPNPKKKLNSGEPAIVLEVNVTYRERKQLTEDLQLPSNFKSDLLIKKGTTLYKTRLRRSAENAATFNVWCGPYQFSHARVRNQTGWNLVCFQDLGNGRTGAYFQPHPVTYVNGTKIPKYHTSPPVYATELRQREIYDIPFPNLEPATDAAPPLQLLLVAERPENQFSTAAYWILSNPADYFSTRVRLENAPLNNNRLRIRLGDAVLQTDFLPTSRVYAAPSIEKATITDVPQRPFMPLLGNAGYANYFDASGPTSSTAVDEPWRLGTLRLKPETLTITSGALNKDQTLLTIKAHRAERRTVVNAAPQNYGNYFLNGTPVYEWVRPGYQADGTVYLDRLLCGIGQITAPLATSPISLCAPQSPQNWIGEAGQSMWDITPRGSAVPYPHLIAGFAPYDTVSAPDPSPEAFIVEIKVDRSVLNETEIRLGLQEGGKFVQAERLPLRTDKDGIARLHLWNRVIELRREGDGFVAETKPTNSGYGLFYDLPAE